MKKASDVTTKELGALVISGLILTTGSIGWIWGPAHAALCLGLALLYAAWCCVD